MESRSAAAPDLADRPLTMAARSSGLRRQMAVFHQRRVSPGSRAHLVGAVGGFVLAAVHLHSTSFLWPLLAVGTICTPGSRHPRPQGAAGKEAPVADRPMRMGMLPGPPGSGHFRDRVPRSEYRCPPSPR